jgi:hypothetical protein
MVTISGLGVLPSPPPASSGDVHPICVATANELRNRCAAQGSRKTQLVAAGHENAVGLGDVLEELLVETIFARIM